MYPSQSTSEGLVVRWLNAHNFKQHLREGQGLDLIASELKFTFQDSGRRGKKTHWAKVQKYTHVKVIPLLEQLRVSVFTFQTTESS